ncbi:DUF4392 domain-containing protein [Treponema ruminis]|uniref:D-glutamate cyclase-like C-terminal domain-containing protein n=1 Tax=Treponema ruminis TaxID=744515 RepID=A0A7W8G9U0_9SPIR|nr:DUF4392 domain-containing protein [Treponema ruminis]MBB5226451.1 hypothetical protein [Treponema ruminis]QSI02645.1 DUF4392 domain-containing protein [Treponema ruminis]
MGKIEDIVLRHSARGMDILRTKMKGEYAKAAAEMILSWEKGTVFLATGFFVAGFAETDGPAGTIFLALALKKLGYNPVVITDSYTKGFFECRDIEAVYMPFDGDEDWCRGLLKKYQPVGLISIERCGKNSNNDYANMRGVSIADRTAKIDILFELAYGHIPTIGVGDGGNEIGMGNVASIVSEKLSLVPCVVKTDLLVIATVSNWGAYAITAYLEKLSGRHVLMKFADVYEYIRQTVSIGSVDGVRKERTVSVDGFEMNVEEEIINSLREAV